MRVVTSHRVFGITLTFWVCFIWLTQHHRGVSCTASGDESAKLSDTFYYCVDLSWSESICSQNPVDSLERMYSKKHLNAINIGVAQTIDGTEEEKNSIRIILTQMNHYWKNEVLSNFEYDEARAFW